MSQANPITATIDALKDSLEVGIIVDGRIYGAEVPADQATSMPRAAIVCAVAGTPSTRPGTNDYIRWSKRRVDVRCYGATFSQSMNLCATAEAALKAWTRRQVGQTLVDSFTHTAGPIQLRDPDTDWPVIITTFNVLYADALLN